AVDVVGKENFDCILLDVRMPKMDGVQTLDKLLKINSDIPIIMMTAFGSREIAMDAIRKGAYDYFTKPFDINEMRVVVKRALEKQKLEDEIRKLRTKLDQRYDFDGIVGQSRELMEVFELVTKVMKSDVTVMIYGESGTGKELIANLIHHRGPRNAQPMVKLNCAAIPDTLLESELFGYEKGAFTGAVQRKIGKFEQADRGTIFLDEIGDMSLVTQAKLLRALESHKIERLGGNEVIDVDIRVITATNQDLQKAVREGRFREDLFFRLNVLPIYMPPLRARKGDIPLLTDFFIEKSSEKLGKQVRGVSRPVMRKLLAYGWPGNVRELENIIQRAVLLSSGDLITEDCLPTNLSELSNSHNEDEGVAFEGSLQEIVDNIAASAEKQLIMDALEKTEWSRTKTADLLKICRKSLHNKMKKYGLFEMDKDQEPESV
ncbi:MAG TPA: sigma-54 dependent transcriptional regulator, partial [bacterium]|nr:sigma-54 dependent transcriptional regulator [bacterium]